MAIDRAVKNVKKYPRMPHQIITDRRYRNDFLCPYIESTGESHILNKCSNCGIGTENFVASNLADIRGRMQHSIALIERVDCPAFDKWAIPKEEAIKEDYYFYGDKWYHFIRAFVLPNTNNICIERRACREYDKDCVMYDVKHVHNTFNEFDQIGRKAFNNISMKNIELENGLDYRIYNCEKSGYKEFIIPLYADDTCKTIMAMMVFGQIIIEDEGGWDELLAIGISSADAAKNITIQKIKQTTIDDRRYFKNRKEVFELHGEGLSNYIKRMQERVQLCKKDFLFEFQTNLLKELSYQEDIRQSYSQEDNFYSYDIYPKGIRLLEKVSHFFALVAEQFDLRRCLLFVPNLMENIGEEGLAYKSHFISGFGENSVSPELNLQGLLKFKNGKIDAHELKKSGHLLGYPFDENSKGCTFLYGSQDADFFIGVLIEWQEKENLKDIELHDTFFSSIIALARSIIMAFIVECKKARLDEFSEGSRHDIAGKSAILLMHLKSFSWDMKDFEKVLKAKAEIPRIQAWQFFRQSEHFHEQMEIVYDSLSLLQRTLDTEDLIEYAKPESFEPRNRLMKDFNQQFNNPLYQYSRHKRLLIYNKNSNLPNMYADPVMIERMLQNMLENAFKYAYDGTNVYLLYGLEQVDGQNCHVFRVRNFGRGIAEDVVSKIFRYGVQGESGSDGKGQGLPLARKYARLNGGAIELTKGIVYANKTQEENESLISHICVPLFPLAELKFPESEKEDYKEMLERIQKEKKRLSSIVVDNPIGFLGKVNRYKEIISNNYEPDNDFVYLTLIHFLDRPTYIIEFTATIPHKILY